MKTYKTIGFSLILSSILVIIGCSSNKNNTEANSSQQSSSTKLELEIHKEIQTMLDSNPYKTILSKSSYKDAIEDYTKKKNLLRVKVDKNNHIRLFFDNTLLPKVAMLEDITDPINDEAYRIAIKYKLENAQVTIYADGKEVME